MKIGVFLARMQPVHNAHLYMVEKACSECEKVVVILGSKNKKDMLRNPFTIEKRKEMLLNSLPEKYSSKIEVYEIPDWSREDKISDNKFWGRYFYYNVVSRIGQKTFDLYYSDGKDNLDSWFKDTEVYDYISYKICERSAIFNGLSATKIREAFVNNDRQYILAYCPPIVYLNFNYLRDYYLKVLDNPKEDIEMV